MKLSVFIGTSVDGFIAREDGSLDWLPAGGGEEHGYTAFMASVQAVVIGRKTYETVLAFDRWPYVGKRVVVLSGRSIPAPPQRDAAIEVMAGDPREIASRLAASDIEQVYVDGGVTVQRFLEAGLIQRMIITRVPVLLGRGIPLFGPLSRDVHLQHIATRSYPSGLVTSEYTLALRGQQA